MEFLEVYKSYAELINKVQEQFNKRMSPKELLAILFDKINVKEP
jgi:hypothetical protein